MNVQHMEFEETRSNGNRDTAEELACSTEHLRVERFTTKLTPDVVNAWKIQAMGLLENLSN